MSQISLVKVATACALRVHRGVEQGRKSSRHGVETSAHEAMRQFVTTIKMQLNQGHRFCVAPMMEWTDRAEKQSVIST